MESFLIQVQVAKLSEIDSLLGYGDWGIGNDAMVEEKALD